MSVSRLVGLATKVTIGIGQTPSIIDNLLARIVATATSGLSPEVSDPSKPAAARLPRPGLTINDIDLVDINEAFAAQVIPYRELGIYIGQFNVNGGGIALGHPFGATGARITTTLPHALQEPGSAVRTGDHVCRWRPGHGDHLRKAQLMGTMTFTVSGRTVVVTGAARGVGFANGAIGLAADVTDGTSAQAVAYRAVADSGR